MVSTAEERTRIWIETFSGLLVDTATATKIVGHKLEKMWKQYYPIDKRGLTKAVEKLNKDLQNEHAGEHLAKPI